MDIYKRLFNKGYIKGDNFSSPLSMKGIKKLCDLFKQKYNFIDIIIIVESDFNKEFREFFRICENSNIDDVITFQGIKNKIYSSYEEDLLFEKLESFNKKYKYIKDKEEITSNNDFLTLLDLYGRKEHIVKNLVCKKILKSKKEKELNFYIWSDEEDNHFSLVCNIETYYLFLDSCSIFFRRWPSNNIISKTNDKDDLYKMHKTIVMKSVLQNDFYNCGFYVFSMMDILCTLYIKNDKPKLFKYLFKYFNQFSEKNEVISEATFGNNEDDDEDNFLFLLPEEFLRLSNSLSSLTKLKNKLELKNTDNIEDIKLIDDIINELKIKPRIDKIKESLLLDLLKNEYDFSYE